MSIKISRKNWGDLHGQNLYLFTLQNSSGAYTQITNYGATLVNIVVPDKNDKPTSVIIGFPDAESYLHDDCYMGSTVGPYANRISKARFTLNGNSYKLDANDGVNCNHSGNAGFNNQVFDFEITANQLILTLHSTDGAGGYPGNISLKVSYKWSEDNELTIRYHAVSDKDTYANFTNHAYFNLSDSPTVFNHQLTINAQKQVVADDTHIPTGEIKNAGDNAFSQTIIGSKIKSNEHAFRGINTYYILDKEARFAAKLGDEKSGIELTVNTSYPGVFLYTGDYLHSKNINHNNRYCQPFEGLCLECQHYPDSMNRPEFPQAVLLKNQDYDEYITFKFSLL